MHGNIGAVPRERHQSGMTVKIGIGQNNGPIHGGPLQFMGSGGVAVVDVNIILNIKGYMGSIITAHLHFRTPDAHDGSEVSVLYAHSRVVL